MGWGVLALIGMATSTASAADLHDRINAFAATPLEADPTAIFEVAEALEQLRDEARQAAVMDDDPDDDGPTTPAVDQLLASRVLTFDAEHRIHRTDHTIAVLRKPVAVKWFDAIEVVWSPWLEDRPEVHARVILPDGTIRTLDPATLTEGGATQGRGDLYTTDRLVTGPLPPATAGAIVERWVVRKPKRSMSQVAANAVWQDSPRPHTVQRFEVRSPAGSKVTWSAPSDADKPRKARQDGLHTLTWTVEARLPTDPQPEPEPWTPPELWRVSLGADWATVATDYATQVAGKNDPSGTDPLVAKVKAADGRRARIATALREVRDHLQYTGLEFGTSAIVPYTPAESLERGYGDCKDQATLLRTLLAEVDIQAELALVSAAWPDRAHPDHPGLSGFDHVIVHIPEDNLWIDPTARWGSLEALPLQLEGQHALIVTEGASGLTEIPWSNPGVHSYHEVRDLTLRHGADGTFSETVETRGEPARWMSGNYVDDNGDLLTDGLKGYIERHYGDTDPTIEVTPSRADHPQATLTATGEAPAWTVWQGVFEIAPARDEVFQYLPDDLFYEPDPDFPPYQPEPQMPHIAEVEHHVHLPPGYELTSPPANVHLELGDAALDWTTTWDAHTRTASMHFRFDSGDGRFTIEEWQELGRWVRLEADGLTPAVLGDPADDHLQAGRYPEAIAAYTALVDAHPDHAWPRSRRARALLDAGLGELARSEAEAAVALDPENDLVLFDLGFIALHDDAGLESPHYPYRDLARSTFERAMGDEPNEVYLRNLSLLSRRPALTTFGLDHIQETADAYDPWLDLTAPKAGWGDGLRFLLSAGRYDRVIELTDKHPDTTDIRSYRLAAIALAKGVPAALSELVRLETDPEARRSLGATAYQHLYLGRHYTTALAWAEARPSTFDDPVAAKTALDLLNRLQRWEDVLDPDRDPAHAYLAMLMETIENGGIDPDSELVADAAKARAEAFDEAIEGVVATLATSGLSADMVIDVLLAMNEVELQGSPKTGQRIVMRSPFVAQVSHVYIVGKKKHYQVYADGPQTDLLGARVLTLMADGEEEAAADWYSWLLEADRSLPGSDRNKLTNLDKELARKDIDTRDRQRIVAALASLDDTPAVDTLQSLIDNPDLLSPELRTGVWFMAAGFCMKKTSLACTRRLLELEVPPPEERPEVLAKTRHLMEGLADPEAYLEHMPDLAEAEGIQLVFAAIAHGRLHQFEQAIAMHEAALEAGSTGIEAAGLAGFHLFGDTGADKALEVLGTLQVPDGKKGLHHRLVLASALAETDQPLAAKLHLQETWTISKARDFSDMSADWWFVMGRMADTYGFPEVARDYYQRYADGGGSSEYQRLIDARAQPSPGSDTQ